MIGEQLGNFRVVARIGAGGMGEVYVAEQVAIHTRVAIKVLHAPVSSERAEVQRFFNEAVAASAIKHAGIVKIFDVGFHGDRAYLVMELLEGESLAARIRRLGVLGVAATCDVGRQLAGVLAETHAAAIVHRDLKPDNAFLVYDGELASRERVKVLDFGIAKLAGSTSLSHSGGQMGTPAYMAPEQWASSSRVDGRADIYSLGCLLFEACTGRPPFVVASLAEACTSHLTAPPPRLCEVAAAMPAELDAVIARMLAKDPADRPTLAAIQQELAGVAATVPALVPAAPPPLVDRGAATMASTTLGSAVASRSPSPPRPRRRWPVFAVGAAALVVGVAVVVTTRHSRETSPSPSPSPSPSLSPSPSPSPSPPLANPFIPLDPPPHPVTLGLPAAAPPAARGFRAGRLRSPDAPFAIQQHEVTWSELDPAHSHPQPHAPATASWPAARDYCKSLGANLPTESQWEFAARGPALRATAWPGDPRVDHQATHTAGGSNAQPVDVEASEQDVTPERVYDLVGNVQEWTEDLWRSDTGGGDDGWASHGETSYRAVRGLPLRADPDAPLPAVPSAYREPRCATGACNSDRGEPVGFRCVRAVTVTAQVNTPTAPTAPTAPTTPIGPPSRTVPTAREPLPDILSLADFNAVIDPQRSKLVACLAQTPAGTDAAFVAVTVTAGGQVANVAPTAGTGDAFATCLRDIVMPLVFQPAQGSSERWVRLEDPSRGPGPLTDANLATLRDGAKAQVISCAAGLRIVGIVAVKVTISPSGAVYIGTSGKSDARNQLRGCLDTTPSLRAPRSAKGGVIAFDYTGG